MLIKSLQNERISSERRHELKAARILLVGIHATSSDDEIMSFVKTHFCTEEFRHPEFGVADVIEAFHVVDLEPPHFPTMTAIVEFTLPIRDVILAKCSSVDFQGRSVSIQKALGNYAIYTKEMNARDVPRRYDVLRAWKTEFFSGAYASLEEFNTKVALARPEARSAVDSLMQSDRASIPDYVLEKIDSMGPLASRGIFNMVREQHMPQTEGSMLRFLRNNARMTESEAKSCYQACLQFVVWLTRLREEVDDLQDWECLRQPASTTASSAAGAGVGGQQESSTSTSLSKLARMSKPVERVKLQQGYMGTLGEEVSKTKSRSSQRTHFLSDFTNSSASVHSQYGGNAAEIARKVRDDATQLLKESGGQLPPSVLRQQEEELQRLRREDEEEEFDRMEREAADKQMQDIVYGGLLDSEAENDKSHSPLQPPPDHFEQLHVELAETAPQQPAFDAFDGLDDI
jgi:hypothetical protein